MGYNGKLSTQGINILKNIYLSNPLIEFTEIQRKYNQEAKKYGLNQIKSSSTVANYLVRIGVYEKSSRRSKEEFEGIRRIKASGELQKEISSKLKVTTRSVFSALSYVTNSPTARLIRSYALAHGAELYELKKVENPYEEVIQL